MVLENPAVLGNMNNKLGHMELEKKEKIREIIEKKIVLCSLMHLKKKQIWWYMM